MSTQAADLARERSFRLGTITVEPALCLVRASDGAEFKLEPRVMQVLVTLAAAKNRLLSRSDLRDACWNGRLTSDDAIDRVIAQIRRLATTVGGNFAVETVPKVGYRLIELQADEEKRQLPRHIFNRRTMLGVTLAAGASATAIGFYRARRTSDSPRGSAPLTIAVLPFTSEAPLPQLATFAAALSDEVRSDLSRVVDIRVIAQTSSRKVVDKAQTAQEIGAKLAADYLVEGEVGTTDGQFVTRVALVDTTNGSEVWTAQETAPAADPTGLRSAIAGDVIQQLAGIIPISAKPAAPVQRPDPEAYALVQEANRLLEDVRMSRMRGRETEALSLGDKAERFARHALAIEPSNSGALAILAAITRNGWTSSLARQDLTTEQRVQASIAIVRQALLADPENPAALTALGDFYRRYEFRWDEAENLFRRALQVDPSFVDAHWSYAFELGTQGRGVEGLDHALSVFELDPRYSFHRIALPRLLYLVGDRAGAMRRYNAELSEQPDNLFLLRELYFMLLSEGNAADLQSLGRRLSSYAAKPELIALARRIDAGTQALKGSPQKLRGMIDHEVALFDQNHGASDATPQGRARDDMPFIFAIEYAWAGLPERSIDMLERALVAKSLYWPASLPYGIAPFPTIVRNNPRYQALWQRDPGVIELVQRRRSAILNGEMAGFAPDGRKRIPHLPTALAQRVKAALSMQV